ncbi:MAG: DMT family transporter [Spirochaetales bacterium]|nr:DMT family transporter [Spirochaetales bacterium]
MSNRKNGATPARLLLLTVGEIFGVSSVYFIKNSTLEPVLLASFRLLTASFCLLPLFIKEWKKTFPKPTARDLLLPCIPGTLLALHFITWIMGARLIPSAHSTLIVNLTPAVTPFLLFFLTKERLNRKEALASLFVLTGCFLMVRGDFHLERSYVKGDIYCFLSMIILAVYLVFSKRSMKGIWTYLFPLYLTGGLVCFGLSFFLTDPFSVKMTTSDLIAVGGLGLICTVGGHSIMNWAMKKMRGQLVSLFNASQFIYAGIMGYLVFGEVPRRDFLLAGAVIVSGLVISIPGGLRKEESPPPRKH